MVLKYNDFESIIYKYTIKITIIYHNNRKTNEKYTINKSKLLIFQNLLTQFTLKILPN